LARPFNGRQRSQAARGRPARITEKEGAPEGEMAFDAVFEVFPEVKIGDLSDAEVEKITTEVSDAAIDRTLDILRKQRRTFAQRAQDAAAQDGDRVTVDFEGKIDGEPFEGGKAEDFQFLVGEGQMLKEFEDAVRGMKSGESKTFPLAFPADYHGKDVAGKTADFMVTVKKIEAAHLPEVNERWPSRWALPTAPSKACAPTSRRTWSAKSSSACWRATSTP
jgi:trigger factor